MQALAQNINEIIRQHQLQGLPANRDLTFPAYQGYSLSNIPASVCRLLDVPDYGEPPLGADILAELGGPYKKVVLLVVDALGFTLLNHYLESDHAAFLKAQLANSLYLPLTSICPSTTASALTTLWTGVSPATHGVIGYEMWAKEYGMVINNILHSAISFYGDTGGLRRAGFDPDAFLGRKTLGSHLADNGVESSAYLHYSIGSSGLSSMHLNNVNLHGYISEADMWVNMRNVMNANPDQRAYIYAYWSTIDTLTHRFGAYNERLAYEFSSFFQLFQSIFIEGLTKQARRDTLFIVTADHGSKETPRYDHFDLRNHTALNDMLRIQPTCEHRLVFLYTKPGMAPAVSDYFTDQWGDKFTLITSQTAFDIGLFGPGPHHPAIDDRVGDLIAIAHDDAYLWWADKPNVMLGRHGGLNTEEMLIPFYALPL